MKLLVTNHKPISWGKIYRKCQVRKVAERKFPEFFEFLSRILSRILLRICLRSFGASFRGKRRPEKIHQKSPAFFKVKFPGKFAEKIHKSFLESWQSEKMCHQYPAYSSFVDGRVRAIVITESLARVIAKIQRTRVRWRS